MMVVSKKYGEVPESFLAVLIKRRVSKANYEQLLSKFGYVLTPWSEVEKFINKNLSHGRYRTPKWM